MENETVKELAKLGTAAVEFANRVFGGPLEEIGGLAADQLGYWRARRRLKLAQLLERARQYYVADAPNLSPHPVPPKLLEPIIRNATLEEDTELAEMWASLLASAAHPEGASRVQPSFAAALAQLSPQAARVLDMLYGRAIRHGKRLPIRPSKVKSRCRLSPEEYERSIDALLITGFVRVPSDVFVVARLGDGHTEDKTTTLALILTATGFDFVEACRRGRPIAVTEEHDEPEEDDQADE